MAPYPPQESAAGHQGYKFLYLFLQQPEWQSPDMEKGADTRTLSAEIFENCGNFLIVEDWILLFWNKSYEL